MRSFSFCVFFYIVVIRNYCTIQKQTTHCIFLIRPAPPYFEKKETCAQIYCNRSHFCKWFLETPHGSGQRVINNIHTVSSVPVQVFTDNPAGTKAMWTGKKSKGNCLLPINQRSALLPERSEGSAGRSMQPRKLSVFWCWLQTCININLLTGLCFPLDRLSTGPNQSSLRYGPLRSGIITYRCVR